MSMNSTMMYIGKVLAVGVLLVSSTACWSDNVSGKATDLYDIVALKSAQLDVKTLGLSDCTSMLELSATRVLAACRAAGKDTGDDYGLRLYVLGKDSAKLSILSSTRGLGDAYAINLQLRRSASGKPGDLLLADAAAEYAYGTAMFKLEGDKLSYLGELGMVQMSADQNPSSALDITKIQQTKDGFKVSFAGKVYRLDKNGEYKPVNPAKAFVEYDGKKLRY